MAKKIVVKNCKHCPFHQVSSNFAMSCKAGYEIKKWYEIPDWCPLGDETEE